MGEPEKILRYEGFPLDNTAYQPAPLQPHSFHPRSLSATYRVAALTQLVVSR
jgi:hypothetical protein